MATYMGRDTSKLKNKGGKWKYVSSPSPSAHNHHSNQSSLLNKHVPTSHHHHTITRSGAFPKPYPHHRTFNLFTHAPTQIHDRAGDA
jgi:hypothetical protein